MFRSWAERSSLPTQRRRLRTPASARLAAWLGCSLGVVGCATQPAPAEPAAPDATERRPPAVAVDLPSQTPEVRDRARADDGIVSLRAPLGLDAARSVVKAFFDAVVREDLGALANVVAPRAQVLDLASPAATSPAATGARMREALGFWGQRFRQNDYGQLAGQPPFRDGDVQIFDADHHDALPARVRALRGARVAGESDPTLVLRVPVLVPNVRSQRLFGREIYFWLERQQDRYVVVELAEAFPY